MICPVCRFGNFPGDDTCANCGADLWNADTPQPATTFRGRLLGMHLDELGAPAPDADRRRRAGRRGDRADAGRGHRLPARHRATAQLVGIFTDRDAILKVAGQPPTVATDRRA